ncbi:MAG: exodeoxyribonuclease III [Rhodospirillales bacterium]|nr:exodeoxyribonuclease III [Rhodospirillales bacterium]
MKLATWNVNSIRQRQALVADWLQRHQPDLLLLQEIKCEAAQFPALAFPGYHAEIVGQKSYNGVAVLGRIPFEVRARNLPDLPEPQQARWIEVEAGGIVIGNGYFPNGNSGGAEGFAAKLAWMEALRRHAAALLEDGRDLAILGDYNVCPGEEDLAAGALAPGDALVRPETRAAFRALLWLGLTDAVRALHPSGRIYTFWDYQAAAFERDAGLRIDHALLSARLAERLVAAAPDREERARVQPSDHVPVLVELAPG